MSTTTPSDVRDLALAPEGVRRIEWADRQMPVLAPDPRAVRGRAAARGHPHRRLPARHQRDRQPDAHAEGGRRRRRAVRLQPALHPGRRRGRRSWPSTASPSSPDNGEDNDTYYSHIEAAADHHPQLTMDDGADVIGVLHAKRPEQLERDPGRHRGDHDRRHPAEGDGGRRHARVPDRGRQRGQHQAPVRQPLRHRPVDPGRHHPGHQRAAGRQHLRRRRLRLERARPGRARPRHGRPRHRRRGRPAAGAAGRDGRLQRLHDGRGRPPWRHLLHRHRRQAT